MTVLPWTFWRRSRIVTAYPRDRRIGLSRGGNNQTQNEVKTHIMKLKLMAASLLAATFSALVANACPITVAVDCAGNLLNGVTVNLFDCAGNYVATGVTGQGGVSGFITIPMGIPACAPCGSGNCFP